MVCWCRAIPVVGSSRCIPTVLGACRLFRLPRLDHLLSVSLSGETGCGAGCLPVSCLVAIRSDLEDRIWLQLSPAARGIHHNCGLH